MAEGLIRGSAHQIHCVTGDSVTSLHPLHFIASASISTHMHACWEVGGAELQFLYDSSLLPSDARAWLGPYTLPSHTHTLTHTSVSSRCWDATAILKLPLCCVVVLLCIYFVILSVYDRDPVAISALFCLLYDAFSRLLSLYTLPPPNMSLYHYITAFSLLFCIC